MNSPLGNPQRQSRLINTRWPALPQSFKAPPQKVRNRLSMKPVFGRLRSLKFEPLEPRQVLSASTLATDQTVTPQIIVVPDANSGVSGLTPAQIRAAYGFNNITFGSVVGNGAGETIAIVDAYNDPNILSDLATFDKQFGIAAPPNFKVVNENGGTSLPSNNRGWSSEI